MAGQFRRTVVDSLRVASKSVFAAADTLLPSIEAPRILIYHQIGAGLGRQMEVSQECFAQQISWLADNASIVDLETAIDYRSDPNPRKPRTETSVVLTFDDGYEDFYRFGFPLLLSHGFPFVLYLTTEPVETRRPLGPPQATPVSWDQVNEMAATGLMTLGAHTHKHQDLRFVGPADIAADLSIADALIEQNTGVVPRHFAYPYGYWSVPADREVRARYSTAALGGGRPYAIQTDPHLLHRIPIQLSDGMFFFKRKLERGLRLEETARRLIARYRGP